MNRLWLTSSSRPRTFCRSRCRWVWYTFLCLGCSSTSRTCSCFSGRSAATCSLVRRMISGLIRRRSCAEQLGVARLLDGPRVVLAEPLGVREQPGRGDRQQRPQLHQVVLHRRAGDRDLERRRHPARALVRLGLVVLDVLGLVEEQPGPLRARRRPRSRAAAACRRSPPRRPRRSRRPACRRAGRACPRPSRPSGRG